MGASLSDLHGKVRMLLLVQSGAKDKSILDERIGFNHERVIPLAELAKQTDKESLQLMKDLLALGADPNVDTVTGIRKSNVRAQATPLYNAVTIGASKGVELLAKHRADVNRGFLNIIANYVWYDGPGSEQDFVNQKMLLLAKARILLAYGADPDGKHNGFTVSSPLHRLVQGDSGIIPYETAFRKKHAQVTRRILIELLLHYRADPDLQDEYGKTAKDYAREVGDKEVLQRLEQASQPAADEIE